LAGGKPSDEEGIRFQNTLFKVTGDEFLANTETMQTEGFGPLSLAVMAKDMDQFYAIADSIEGSLTGSVYGSASDPAAQELVSSNGASGFYGGWHADFDRPIHEA